MTDHSKPRRRASGAIALVAAGLVGGLGATAANAGFDDVPSEGQFAEHIESVQEAGIATGYQDGTFRPTRALTRQQAAAWLDRAAGRSALDFSDQTGEQAPVTPADPSRVLATIEMASPATSGGGGWVVLEGGVATATVDETGAGCPCAFDIEVFDSEGDRVAVAAMTTPGPESDDERTWAGPVGTAPVHGAVWLPGGTSETYTLRVTLIDSDVGPVFVAGSLSGQYSPMAEGEPTVHDDSGADPVTLVPGG
jgi:hypothetical protein